MRNNYSIFQEGKYSYVYTSSFNKELTDCLGTFNSTQEALDFITSRSKQFNLTVLSINKKYKD